VIYKTSSGELAEIDVRLMGSGALSAAAPSGAPTASSAEPTEATSRSEGPAVTPDDPREDRIAFVRAAVRAPRENGIGELALLLREDDDATIRAAAAAALGKLRDEEAGDALSLALADRDRTVRRAAARAFGAVGGSQGIEALERVLLEERASEVRRMAAYALSRMDAPPALSALEIARSDRDRTVRAIAETALSRDQD
jgi:HEAT repeat protein